jgi:hypothetical protein
MLEMFGGTVRADEYISFQETLVLSTHLVRLFFVFLTYTRYHHIHSAYFLIYKIIFIYWSSDATPYFLFVL